MNRFSLPKGERLRGLTAITTLFREGRQGFVYPFRYVYICRQRPDSIPGQRPVVLFSVPKRFHKRANKRNLLKRRSREAYRLNRDPLLDRISECGCHELQVAIIYSTKEIATYKTIEHGIRKIIEEIRQTL